ncbi:hypothetical protein LR48_Vigan319s001200 [Vigna angularis]|uniref:Uncharacterized protein n=1 Tax=Phaseolus angularis TaxID=3914 RepID=A0A0L9T8A4_PHAAN|nr:hypothetical protein LR48_Vigan319s001200 [Vigna angularis]
MKKKFRDWIFAREGFVVARFAILVLWVLLSLQMLADLALRDRLFIVENKGVVRPLWHNEDEFNLGFSVWGFKVHLELGLISVLVEGDELVRFAMEEKGMKVLLRWFEEDEHNFAMVVVVWWRFLVAAMDC